MGALLRRHIALVALVTVGVLVRVGMMFAYYPAYGYFYDTQGYMDAARTTTPGAIWPFGYSAMLKVLDVATGHIVTVSALQHLMGVVMGVLVYALLQKRGVRRWWSALAAAPVLLDARHIQLEHFVLSETLFSFLMIAGIVLLMWLDKPPLWLMALSGVVFALATLTRTVGQPLVALIVVYLIVRRIGWQRFAAFVVALAIPIGGYMVWYHRHHDAFALNGYSGRYMWQRTTTFVDCTRSDFTPQEREICPPEPLGQREVGDVYLWGLDHDRIGERYPGAEHDKLFSQFAIKAILGQPNDFVAAVAADAWHLVQPGWQAPTRIACTTDLWSMPSGPRHSNVVPTGCKPPLMDPGFKPVGKGWAGGTATPLNTVLWAYGKYVVLPPWVLVLLALFALVSAAWRVIGRRRFGGREAADSALLALMSLAILLLGVTLSVIDLRFTVPLVSMVPLAAALALHRITTRPAVPVAPVAPVAVTAPAAKEPVAD